MNLEEIAATATRQLGSNQREQELTRYLAWLIAENPKYIVEVGVESGGTSWAVRMACPEATMIAVDLNVPPVQFESRAAYHFVRGSSSEVAEKVRALYQPDEAVVFIDADHRYEAVVTDTKNYPGKFQVYHDIQWMPGNQAPRGQGADRFYREHQNCCFCQTFENGWAGIGVRRPLLCSEHAFRCS
jgi:hypothetical protein